MFFGEGLPKRFFKLSEHDFDDCDLLLVIGTSLVVQPSASLVGEHLARSALANGTMAWHIRASLLATAELML